MYFHLLDGVQLLMHFTDPLTHVHPLLRIIHTFIISDSIFQS